jgi:adenosylcobyric acid synthase
MFAGTGSEVGKSVVAAAFCRIFRQDGYHPAPFKAQNMSLNSYATPEGLEIGRAQAVQAEAAGVPCHTDMNPLLLKPASDKMCQVVLNGRPVGNREAYQYFKTEGREFYREQVVEAFRRLEARYNPIVLEGAGSIAEINLRRTDLVNLPMAMSAGADVILVADIDRGGVFAAVYGSIALLRDDERPLIKGILINKFRGDIRLFEEGIAMLEELCGVPVLGVIPHYTDIFIEEEDSVSLQKKNRRPAGAKINVAVVRLRHLSNFTDFNRLERDRRAHLFYTDDRAEIERADVVILPGTKNTIADLDALHESGAVRAVRQAYDRGATVVGLCGGYQMLGRAIRDPEGIEGSGRCAEGIGLLPVETTLEREKVTRQVNFTFRGGAEVCTGYEIHQGRTVVMEAGAHPLNRLADGTEEGCFRDERCFGTYIHGILDNPSVVDYLLKSEGSGDLDWAAFRQTQYDRLADHVRRHVDMERIYRILRR